MVRLPILSLIVTMLVMSGCDDPQRTARLEKENADLKAQLKEKNVERNYEFEARCSKDARVWFNQNFSRDKDTTLLDFSNHYHSPSNRCFAFVEYHFREGVGESWMNEMSLWNVYENSKYGSFLEEHVINFKNPSPDSDTVVTCEMLDAKCTTIDQFNASVRPYMTD